MCGRGDKERKVVVVQYMAVTASLDAGEKDLGFVCMRSQYWTRLTFRLAYPYYRTAMALPSNHRIHVNRFYIDDMGPSSTAAFDSRELSRKKEGNFGNWTMQVIK